MNLRDFEGPTTITTEEELLQRLTRIRRGDFGAFILDHDPNGPSLWVNLCRNVAYLHYFIGEGEIHPGYQPTGMTPVGCSENVRFLIVGGDDADSICMPRETLVSADQAVQASVEFLRDAALPPSIQWAEL